MGSKKSFTMESFFHGWSASSMEKTTFSYQEPVWAQHFSLTIEYLTPFLGMLINTLRQRVLSRQPMQLWFNSSKKEGNTTWFISRAQSYIKLHDWQQKGQFSLLLTTSLHLNVICSENKFSCIKWLSQLLLLHETAKLFCSKWWLREGQNILVV